MKNKSLLLGTLLIPLLAGCFHAVRGQITLDFSRSSGAGTLEFKLSEILCRNERNETCDGADPKRAAEGLENMKQQAEKFRRQLTALGFKDVKAEVAANKAVDSYSGLLRGKFTSLSQVPFFGQIKMRLVDESEHSSEPAHSDLVLEFTLSDQSGIVPLGDGGTFTFRSSDSDAPIMEFSPAGELDKSKHSVTWKGIPAFDHESVFKVRLQGKTYVLPEK